MKTALGADIQVYLKVAMEQQSAATGAFQPKIIRLFAPDAAQGPDLGANEIG
jgi:hypothetical protein